MVADNSKLQELLGVNFKNSALLEEALVHSSYVNENPGSEIKHNERMEFIGDAVLGFIIGEKIYQELPYLNEGQMTKARAMLVKGDTLSGLAKRYLGNGNLYMRIFEANRDQLKDPNLIKIGQKLRIPK